MLDRMDFPIFKPDTVYNRVPLLINFIFIGDGISLSPCKSESQTLALLDSSDE
jgi:hypothetical protein